MTMTERLIKILNLITFIINIVITYGIGTAGWGGAQTTGDISDKYQTIITPDSKAFIIWSIIFITEAIFVVTQFLPRYRSINLIQKGVSYYFIIACLLQTAWTFPFSYELMVLSLILIILIGCSLSAIVISQYYIVKEEKTTFDRYCLFQFPFEVHCGWIIAASILNANIVIVKNGASEVVQLTSGIVSLGILLIISTLVLFFPSKPNYIIPLVAAWASGFIAVELSNPKSSIVEIFSTEIIQSMQLSSSVMSVIIIVLTLFRLTLFVLANSRLKFLPCFGSDRIENDDICVPV